MRCTGVPQWAGLPEAAEHGVVRAEGSDLAGAGKAAGERGAQRVDPAAQRALRGGEEPRDLGAAGLVRAFERREPGGVQDFVSVGVAMPESSRGSVRAHLSVWFSRRRAAAALRPGNGLL
jgi:hypothetical protein